MAGETGTPDRVIVMALRDGVVCQVVEMEIERERMPHFWAGFDAQATRVRRHTPRLWDRWGDARDLETVGSEGRGDQR